MDAKGSLRIRNATMALPSGLVVGDCVIDRGVIAGIGPAASTDTDSDLEVLEAGGNLLCPGFIDLHVHGGAGYDFSDGTGESVEGVVQFHQQHGTTSLVASVVPGPVDIMREALHSLAGSRDPGILGVHLEGPFLSARRKGALNEKWLRPFDRTRFEAIAGDYEDDIRIVTCAPELEGTSKLIQLVRELGAIPAIGHTACTFEEACTAVEAGATHFTHLFNAMSGLQHRDPGAVGAALRYPATSVELIADGVHVHPWMVAFVIGLLSCQSGPGSVCLVTDCMRAAGMGDGNYTLGGLGVRVTDGVARLRDGTLAGSTLTMDVALRNVIRFAGVSVLEALPMLTSSPADLLGLSRKKGRIAEGADGDVVLLDEELSVLATVRMGDVVFDGGRR